MAESDFEVRAKLIADAAEFVTPFEQAQLAVRQLQAALKPTSGLLVAAGAAAGAAGVALYKYGKEAFGAAARVAELNVSIDAVGRATGLGANNIREAADAIRSQGIEMAASQKIALTYAQNNLKLADAAKIARVGQDLAVLSQRNSTQVAELLTLAIQRGSSVLLKSAGISKYASEGYATYARQIGKNVNSLTAQERQQATVNLVIAEGAKVAGVYERSMTEPGKVLRSFARLQDDMRVEFGKVLLEGFGPSIKAAYDLTSAISKSIREGGVFAGVLKQIGESARRMGQPFADAIGRMMLLVKGLDAGTISVDNFKRSFDRLFAPVVAVSTALATFAGKRVLGLLLGPLGLGGIATKLNPFLAGLSILAALSPQLRESFARMVEALKPLVPVLVGVAVAIADAIAVGVDVFAAFAEVVTMIVVPMFEFASSIASVASSMAVLKPVLMLVGGVMLMNYIKGAVAASYATGGFAARVTLLGLSIKNAVMASFGMVMKLWTNFQFGAITTGSKLKAFAATASAAFRAVGVAIKGLLVQIAPLIAVFAAFKAYEMFTKASREAKERTKELTDEIKAQIYALKGDADAIASYVDNLNGINGALRTTGENSVNLRVALNDLGVSLGDTFDFFSELRSGVQETGRAYATSIGLTGAANEAFASIARTGKLTADATRLLTDEQIFLAKQLAVVAQEANNADLKDLLQTQLNQIRVTSKAGEKAYQAALAEAERTGVVQGLVDTLEELYVMNELLVPALEKIKKKEEEAAKAEKERQQAAADAIKSQQSMVVTINGLAKATEDGKVTVDAMKDALFGQTKGAVETSAAIYQMREAALGLGEGLSQAKGNTELLNESGYKLFDMLVENGARLTSLGGTSGDVANMMRALVDQFRDAAKQGKFTSEQVEALLKQLGILDSLDAITINIEADIAALQEQLAKALDTLAEFSAKSGINNQIIAENYARMAAKIRGEISVLEKARKAELTTEESFIKMQKQSGQESDKVRKQKEKLREEIMRLANEALAKANKRLDEFEEALRAIKDAARGAIYGAYSLTDAFGEARDGAQRAADETQRLKEEYDEYSKTVGDAIKQTLSLSDALSQQQSVANKVVSANQTLAEAQTVVAEEQAIYNDLVEQAGSTAGRRARREAYERAAEQALRLAEAQNKLQQATAEATQAQSEQKSFVERLREQAQLARTFATQIATLVEAGLGQDAIDQIVSAGAQAGSQMAKELIDGGSTAIAETNVLFQDIAKAAETTGDKMASRFKKLGGDLGMDFIAALTAQADGVRQFSAIVQRLMIAGLSPENLTQVLNAGYKTGYEIAVAIEKGGTDTIAQLNALEASLRSEGESLGNILGTTFYQAGYDLAKAVVEGLQAKIKDLEEVIAEATIAGLENILKGLPAELERMLKTLPNKPSEGGAGGPTKPTDPVYQGFAAAGALYASAAAAGMIDPMSTFMPFAKGGIVTKPTLGLVGEAGPEAVIPLSKANALGGGMVVNLTVNAGMGTDGKTVGDAIVNELKRWSRKNGKLPITTS